MLQTVSPYTLDAIYQRSLTAHLSSQSFKQLQDATILIAGLGGGSNIVELLVRKGFGRLILADPDVFESHNVRQRGSLKSTQGVGKVDAMKERIEDINPGVQILPVHEGITLSNVEEFVAKSAFVVDMIDFHALPEKVALYREARRQGRTVVTAPSIINGAILYVFDPTGITFEEFFEYDESVPLPELGERILERLIPRNPVEVPRSMYVDAVRGKRTIPLDAVGVEQAAVLAVGVLENLVLDRADRVIYVPRGIQVDVTDPGFLSQIVDFSNDFVGR